MPDEDPEELADALEGEADRLERHSHEVKERVDAARQDWERKRRDESIPGAASPESDEQAPVEADEDPSPEASRKG